MAGENTKLTKENRVKLEQAAAVGASVEEMAYYCDVSRQTVYNWLKADTVLFDKIERLRQKPILAARQTVAKGVTESYTSAMDYLKRKKRDEFGDRTEITGNLTISQVLDQLENGQETIGQNVEDESSLQDKE